MEKSEEVDEKTSKCSGKSDIVLYISDSLLGSSQLLHHLCRTSAFQSKTSTSFCLQCVWRGRRYLPFVQQTQQMYFINEVLAKVQSVRPYYSLFYIFPRLSCCSLLACMPTQCLHCHPNDCQLWYQQSGTARQIYPIVQWSTFIISLSYCCCLFKCDSLSALLRPCYCCVGFGLHSVWTP